MIPRFNRCFLVHSTPTHLPVVNPSADIDYSDALKVAQVSLDAFARVLKEIEGQSGGYVTEAQNKELLDSKERFDKDYADFLSKLEVRP